MKTLSKNIRIAGIITFIVAIVMLFILISSWKRNIDNVETVIRPSNIEELSEDTKEPDFAVIEEWGLKYKLSFDSEPFSYLYNSSEDFHYDPGLVSSIQFVYNPLSENEKVWAHCELPSINQYSISPEGLGVLPENVRMLSGEYYLLVTSIHEPCFDELQGHAISGIEEQNWLNRIYHIKEIFNSLQPL